MNTTGATLRRIELELQIKCGSDNNVSHRYIALGFVMHYILKYISKVFTMDTDSIHYFYKFLFDPSIYYFYRSRKYYFCNLTRKVSIRNRLLLPLPVVANSVAIKPIATDCSAPAEIVTGTMCVCRKIRLITQNNMK